MVTTPAKCRQSKPCPPASRSSTWRSPPNPSDCSRGGRHRRPAPADWRWRRPCRVTAKRMRTSGRAWRWTTRRRRRLLLSRRSDIDQCWGRRNRSGGGCSRLNRWRCAASRPMPRCKCHGQTRWRCIRAAGWVGGVGGAGRDKRQLLALRSHMHQRAPLKLVLFIDKKLMLLAP